jgi:hypothetical protein
MFRRRELHRDDSTDFRIRWSTSEQASFVSLAVRLHCDGGNIEHGDERELVPAAAETCKWLQAIPPLQNADHVTDLI